MKKQPELESLSPYSIKFFINDNPKTDIRKIWEKLGVLDKYEGLFWEIDKEKGFFNICDSCTAETFTYNLDNEPKSEVLLKVSDRFRENWRYLVFKHINFEKESWKLIGSIEYDFGKYEEPQHAFLLSGGKSYIVIKSQTGSGSGVSLYHDSIFTIQNGTLIKLLSYVSSGHSGSLAYEANRKFTGRVIDIEIKNGFAEIELEFRVDYDDFFIKVHKAVYKVNLKTKKEILDSTKSNISQKEIDDVYNIDSLSNKNFLKYNLQELKKITRKKGTKKFRWLNEFLSRSPNSAEKRSLLKIMKN